MKKLLPAIVTLFFIMFVSCQSTGFLMGKANVTMISEPYSSKDANAIIDVYYTVTPEQKYIEVALITCRDTNDDWCLKQLKIKAREIGADGLIILGKAAIGYMTYFASEEYGMKAVAIKYDVVERKQ